ncbi:MAG: ABC transporter ATP-binding protein [Lentisphaeria bacterium]|nr:ABC transporter ATP-binding protein [Lentisphaeria bacterium]
MGLSLFPPPGGVGKRRFVAAFRNRHRHIDSGEHRRDHQGNANQCRGGIIVKKLALTAENLCKTYGKGNIVVHALNDVSLTLHDGEIAALLGPSGAGKSTLLTSLGLIQAPDSGKITIGNETVFNNGYKTDIRSFRRNHIGFVFQKANLLPFLSAVDNVRLAMEINDISGKAAKRRAEELLAKFDLSERKNFMPKELSGGQQQRVAIARALANTPELLLADEPTAALDSVMGRKVMELLKQIAHEHDTGVLVVTHDHRAIDVFDRIWIMEDGKIKEQ